MIGAMFRYSVNCVMSASCSWSRLCKQWVLGGSLNEEPSFTLYKLNHCDSPDFGVFISQLKQNKKKTLKTPGQLNFYCRSLHLNCSMVQSLSHIQLFATPQTIAHQAPLSVGFFRQEYWSGFSGHINFKMKERKTLKTEF